MPSGSVSAGKDPGPRQEQGWGAICRTASSPWSEQNREGGLSIRDKLETLRWLMHVNPSALSSASNAMKINSRSPCFENWEQSNNKRLTTISVSHRILFNGGYKMWKMLRKSQYKRKSAFQTMIDKANLGKVPEEPLRMGWHYVAGLQRACCLASDRRRATALWEPASFIFSVLFLYSRSLNVNVCTLSLSSNLWSYMNINACFVCSSNTFSS